jgi:RNA polymerase-binding transcription factor DksA
MAKKTQKAKPAKKPAKKAITKKPAKKAAPKKAAKKLAPKKTIKKVVKKVIKKAAPKKAIKPIKKATPKKVIKKTAPKKTIKKVAPKKANAKKTVIKKPIVKKAIAKKLAKKAATPVKKVIVKPVVKTIIKKSVEKVGNKKEIKKPEIKKIAAVKPIVTKPIPVVTKKADVISKKKQRELDADEDDNSRDEAPMIVEYKTQSIRKPMGPTPKPHINTDTRTRYSDDELKEFKELIFKKLGDAQKDFELLKSTLSHKDDHGTDDTSPTFKLLEDGSDVLSKEETAHLASRQEKFIQNLQNALIRIENKTYGICRVTGKLISKERLRSVPHATLAIEAKLEQNA